MAIQGATGSGKTIVGLVIAEWRRRRFQERPIYLCPTRQLVHQVAHVAQDHLGIPAHPFTGKKDLYPPSQKTGWLGGEVLAVTTYSAVFNIKPFFSEPQVIVLDDAHAADQYIGDYWTLSVSKIEPSQKPLFEALASLLSSRIPPDEYARLCELPRSLADHCWVQVVPLPIVIDLENDIASILDQSEEGTDLWFSWQVLKGHLKASQLLISPTEITLRPILPPTETHSPFNDANQRLYMSATLGRGGELERLSGRKSIKRLTSPPGWNGHGVGRRFFLLPDMSFNDDGVKKFIDQLIVQTDPQRALVVTADDHTAATTRDRIRALLVDGEVFSAREIESSKHPFIESNSAVAVIANRYDGIDFPDDECRLLIIQGKPSGMSLLERYLSEVLGPSLCSLNECELG